MKKQTQKKRPEKGAKNTDRAAIILSLFREFPNNKFSLKHLASASGGATKEGRRETFEILGRLHDEGSVEECAREKYRLTHKHLPHFEGVADMTATGSIYVRVEGEEKDIFVNQRNTANALNGDRVEVVVMHRGRNGQLEGEITRIIERNRKPYVGVAEVGAHQNFVRADSRRMLMDIYLSKRTYPDVRDGEKVVARIADWLPGSKSPVGELVERLGMAGNNDTEMHSILAEYELPYRFEPEIEEAAQAIDARVTGKEIAQRRDFRGVTPFRVDPGDAKDFDHALSVRKLKDGVWEVGVHIADVTHYVRPHSVLDDEAINIFKAYLSQNYDDMSLTEEEIFSDAFADTADRIMTVTPSPLPIIAVCAAVIIVAVVVFLIVRNRRLAQQREAERMQEILTKPLESLADAELADLEKKYAQAGASDAPPVQPTKPRP